MAWIPQQLWAPAVKSSGVWTVCIHSNNTAEKQVEELREFVRAHVEQFTSFDRLLAEFRMRPLESRERLYEMAAAWRFILTRRIKKRLRAN